MKNGIRTNTYSCKLYRFGLKFRDAVILFLTICYGKMNTACIMNYLEYFWTPMWGKSK